MYVYDIEEEDTLSDDWTISSTNITITGLEPTPTFLESYSVLWLHLLQEHMTICLVCNY